MNWTNICTFSFQWQEPVVEINLPPACEEPTGLQKEVTEEASAMVLFSIFFNMDFLENIVHETNRFGGESQVEAGKRNHLWTNPLIVAELKAWLGLLIRIGIKQLLQVSYYWSKERVYGVPASALNNNGRNRLRYLHFSNKSKMPAQQEAGIAKLYKVMSLLDVLKTCFEHQCSPHYIHTKL